MIGSLIIFKKNQIFSISKCRARLTKTKIFEIEITMIDRSRD